MAREEDVVNFMEGNARVLVRSYRSGMSAPYPLTSRQWRRAMQLLSTYGERECLAQMDARAEAAFQTGNLRSCLAWRDLMVAVHEACRESPDAGQGTH